MTASEAVAAVAVKSNPSKAAAVPRDEPKAVGLLVGERSEDHSDDTPLRRRLVPDGFESSGDDSVLTAPEADATGASKSNPSKAAVVPGDKPKAVGLLVGERSEDHSDDAARRRRFVPGIFESSEDDFVLIAAGADAAAALGMLTP